MSISAVHPAHGESQPGSSSGGLVPGGTQLKTAQHSAVSSTEPLNIAPGSIVEVRDEEWLVTATETTQANKLLIHVQGLSELVRDTTAMFYESLDAIKPVDPRHTKVVADSSSRYKDTRLWLEANRRKTAVPLADTRLTVSTRMLANTLKYQEAAVRKALDPQNLKPRILLADAVGLGKTIEIGMILSELVRRGRGERILVVTPRHVLEQMQHEMWTRFALPFVRLDSVGIQRVRQHIPASRNPFTFYKRAIISIDTLKSDRYLNALRKQRWDAVVIDEAHNLTNSATQNNRLARILARNADALVLASATPHNGKKDSFAELIRLLDPTAVSADNQIDMREAARLIIRRHRHSPEVAAEVGAEWAERKAPNNVLVAASASERALADELAHTWLYPPSGSSPVSAKNAQLFPWTLAKSFLSSPAALRETIKNRLATITKNAVDPDANVEVQALKRLGALNDRIFDDSAKYQRLVTYLRDEVGVSPQANRRAVVFAERVPTLRWLQSKLVKDLKLKPENVAILHGQLSDELQQEIVDSFKQEHSPIRVLVTGDVASEGVNLHAQCHDLIHFDIPWSLIRIEQRNGRIDRYGQRTSPQITTLLLDTGDDRFSGDIRVLQSLVTKEHEAHKILGEAGSLMGEYLDEREEKAILEVLRGAKSLDEVVASPQQVLAGTVDPIEALLLQLAQGGDAATALNNALGGNARSGGTELGSPQLGGTQLAGATPGTQHPQHSGVPSRANAQPTAAGESNTDSSLFSSELEYLNEAVVRIFTRPEEKPNPTGGGGITWSYTPQHGTAQFTPPASFRSRVSALPQSYLRERRVGENFVLATTKERGFASLQSALADTQDTSWPEAHYLSPLHPVLDWVSDNVMSTLDRSQIFAARTGVSAPTVGLHAILTNKAGQAVSSVYLAAQFFALAGEPSGTQSSTQPGTQHVMHPNALRALPTVVDSLAELMDTAQLTTNLSNPGPIAHAERLTALMAPAIDAAHSAVGPVEEAARASAQQRVATWRDRLNTWDTEANALIQRRELKERRLSVNQEKEAVEQMAPDRLLIRPLFVAVPQDFNCALALPPLALPEPASTTQPATPEV